jgi:hypothetical protein
MKFREFEHQILPHVLIPLLGGLFVLCMLHSGARASERDLKVPDSFIVSTADGYGVNDCIKTGAECAKIVADAWCEAHGHAAATAYGPASDVTGSIQKAAMRDAPAQSISENDVFIICGE